MARQYLERVWLPEDERWIDAALDEKVRRYEQSGFPMTRAVLIRKALKEFLSNGKEGPPPHDRLSEEGRVADGSS